MCMGLTEEQIAAYWQNQPQQGNRQPARTGLAMADVIYPQQTLDKAQNAAQNAKDLTDKQTAAWDNTVLTNPQQLDSIPRLPGKPLSKEEEDEIRRRRHQLRDTLARDLQS